MRLSVNDRHYFDPYWGYNLYGIGFISLLLCAVLWHYTLPQRHNHFCVQLYIRFDRKAEMFTNKLATTINSTPAVFQNPPCFCLSTS